MAEKYKPDTLGVRAGTAAQRLPGALRSARAHHELRLQAAPRRPRASSPRRARRQHLLALHQSRRCAMFQDRLAALEGAEACVATSTGMAAITTMVFGLLKSGDHLVSARGVFGTVVPLLDQIAKKFGIETTWVDATSLDAWKRGDPPEYAAALRGIAVESRCCEVVDIAGAGRDREEGAARCSRSTTPCASPALQQPDRAGRRPRRSIRPPSTSTGRDACWPARSPGAPTWCRARSTASCAPRDPPSRRSTRGSASRAWRRCGVRMRAIAHNALDARALARVASGASSACSIPALESHPQHALAMRQQSGGGAVLSFVVKGGREAAWRVIDAVKLISNTANFGDVKSTICHPATTTHGRLTPAEREAAGHRRRPHPPRRRARGHPTTSAPTWRAA